MLKAALFDQDGVIIDTERDGHRVAFNEAFKVFGLGIEWDVETYHKLLQVGGGKERIKHYFDTIHRGKQPDDLENLVKALHAKKTELLMPILEKMPLRPGIHRLMREIQDAGLKIGICTTSNEKVATMIASKMLADIDFDVVIAGDMVKKKKPDPEIYLSAQSSLKVSGAECLVIEDSAIGVAAALAAGCHVIATVNGYTKDENVGGADFVVTCLGEEGGEQAVVLGGKLAPSRSGIITLKDVVSALR